MPTQAKKSAGTLAAAALAACAGTLTLTASPNADDILEHLQLTAFESNARLVGRIRHDGETTPIRIDITPGRADYRFPGTDTLISVRLGEKGVDLRHGPADNPKMATPADKNSSIAGSDLTLGDLAFEFLYWSNAEFREDERILGRPARQIRVRAPNRDSPYAAVDVFADKQSGALLQMLCYNWDGQLVRRFKVIKGQRVDDQWMLQQMRIESFAPGSRRPASRTYLEIDEVITRP